MDNKITVIDDVVSDEVASTIEESLLGETFPWYYVKGIDYPSSELGDYQFCHMFFADNEWRSDNSWLLTELLEHAGVNFLGKVKANLLPRTETLRKNQFHIDINYEGPLNIDSFKTAIYYVNTCNGYTEFEDNTIVRSVKNRLVIFPMRLRHRGTTCTDQDVRMVINFNYISFPD